MQSEVVELLRRLEEDVKKLHDVARREPHHLIRVFIDMCFNDADASVRETAKSSLESTIDNLSPDEVVEYLVPQVLMLIHNRVSKFRTVSEVLSRFFATCVLFTASASTSLDALDTAIKKAKKEKERKIMKLLRTIKQVIEVVNDEVEKLSELLREVLVES